MCGFVGCFCGAVDVENSAGEEAGVFHSPAVSF